MFAAIYDTAKTQVLAAQLIGANKVYGTKQAQVRALNNVNLEIPAGTWTAIMGPSGSGKSTLLHCLAGLERLDHGQVILDGQDITQASDRWLTLARRDRIGFIFQNFNLMAALTAEHNVALPLRLIKERSARQKARAALQAVGLGDRLRYRPAELSGGQQQRVAIARAMVTKPTVLFADEPTGALDTASANTVLTIMRELVDAGQTIIMVTHDPVCAAAADAVIFLRDGSIFDQLSRPSVSQVADRLAWLEV